MRVERWHLSDIQTMSDDEAVALVADKDPGTVVATWPCANPAHEGHFLIFTAQHLSDLQCETQESSQIPRVFAEVGASIFFRTIDGELDPGVDPEDLEDPSE